MTSMTLIRLGGLSAILAGALRIAASFIPYKTPGVVLELFYLAIDVLILIGVLGIYGYVHEQVGVIGFLGFLSALIGAAVIVGPDGAIGGVQMYVAGSLLISVGLTLLAIGSWNAERIPRAAAALWILSTVVGVGGFLAGGHPLPFLIAGVAFGLAFILAGIKIWSVQNQSGLLGLVFLISTLALSVGAQTAHNTNDKVKLLRVPNSGLQPQALVDERGRLHLIYFSGEPGGGDIFYLHRDPGKTDFSPPIRINSEPNSAVAAGTIRGAHFAIGKNGRIHVAWNGPHQAGREAPMFYARMNDARGAFEPQRNVMQFSGGLDGGGSIAADKDGNVYVVWHGNGSKEGEENRRVWIAKSADDGKTFSREVAAWNEPTGACGCCGMRAFADSQGRVHLLYRAAKEQVNRDMYLLTSVDRGKSFSGMLIDKWKLDVCPMSSAALAEDASRLLAAWETQGQVYFAALDMKNPESASPIQAISSTGKRKHPVIATNGRGERLFVWTEGTGWKKGGSLAWQLYDSTGKTVGEMGQTPGIPVWSFAAVVAEKDGSFTIIY